MRRTTHRRWPALNTSGATALEYALILPVFVMFLLGVMDFGRLMWVYTTLYRATEAAARCAAVNTAVCGTSAQIQSDAAAEAWGMTLAPSTFSVSNPSCGVQVSASYSFTFFTPGFNAIALTPSACFTSLHS
ncbi:MAG: TadE family protein [Rhodomicrobium sp.]